MPKLNCVASRSGLAHLPERDERFQHLGDAVASGANETGGYFSRWQRVLLGQQGLPTACRTASVSSRGQDCRAASAAAETSSFRCIGTELILSLEFGAQPADFAAPFLVGAVAIEPREVGEEIVVAQINRPAIGGKHGTIKVVQTPDHADETAIVYAALCSRQRLAGTSFASTL